MRAAWCALALEQGLRSVSVLPGGQVTTEGQSPDVDPDIAALQANMRQFQQRPEDVGALSRAAVTAQQSIHAEYDSLQKWGDGVIKEHQKKREAERARYLAEHGESSGVMAPDERLEAAATTMDSTAGQGDDDDDDGTDPPSPSPPPSPHATPSPVPLPSGTIPHGGNVDDPENPTDDLPNDVSMSHRQTPHEAAPLPLAASRAKALAGDPAEMALEWAKAPLKAAASWDADMKDTWHIQRAAEKATPGPEDKKVDPAKKHRAVGGPGGGPDLPAPEDVDAELRQHGDAHASGPSDYVTAAAQSDGLEWPPKTPCYVNPAPFCPDGSNAVCCNVQCEEKATCCGSFCCEGRFFCSHDLDRAIAERGHVCWGPNAGKREFELFGCVFAPLLVLLLACRWAGGSVVLEPGPLNRLPLLDAAKAVGSLHLVAAYCACGQSPLLQPQTCSGYLAWLVSLGRLWVVPFFVCAGFLHKPGAAHKTLAQWYGFYAVCALFLALADAPQLDAAVRAKPEASTWLSLLPATSDDGSSAWVYAQRLWWFLRRALLLDAALPFGEDSGLWLFPALVGLQLLGDHVRVPSAKHAQVGLFGACWVCTLVPVLAITATRTVTPDPLLQSVLKLPLMLWPLYVAGMAARPLLEKPDKELGAVLLGVSLVVKFAGHFVAQRTPDGLEVWDVWQSFTVLPLALTLCAAATRVRFGSFSSSLACAVPLYLLHSPVAHFLFIAAAWTPPTFRLFALCLLLAAGGQVAVTKHKAELA